MNPHIYRLLIWLALVASTTSAAEDESVWVTIADKGGSCEIKAQHLPCNSVARYLREQLQVPLATTIYVNHYKRSDREVALSTRKSIREAGYNDVEITSIGFADETR